MKINLKLVFIFVWPISGYILCYVIFTISIWGTILICLSEIYRQSWVGNSVNPTFYSSAALGEQREFCWRSLLFSMWLTNSYLKSILSLFWFYLRAITDPFLTHRSFKYLFIWSLGPRFLCLLTCVASQSPMQVATHHPDFSTVKGPGLRPWTPPLFCSNSEISRCLRGQVPFIFHFQIYLCSLGLCLKGQPNVSNCRLGISTWMQTKSLKPQCPQSSSSPRHHSSCSCPQPLACSGHIPEASPVILLPLIPRPSAHAVPP